MTAVQKDLDRESEAQDLWSARYRSSRATTSSYAPQRGWPTSSLKTTHGPQKPSPH